MSRARQLADHPITRFLVVGGLNTLITGALVGLLSLALPGWVAFTIAFALGIVFSVLATGKWVFRSRLSWRRAALQAGAYIVIYVVGLGVVALIGLTGAPPWANGASVLVTAPLSFLAGRTIFADTSAPKETA